MRTLLNLWWLFGALLLFFFKAFGYSLTFFIQVVCYLIQGKREMIVEAFGFWGRSMTDAAAKIFELFPQRNQTLESIIYVKTS